MVGVESDAEIAWLAPAARGRTDGERLARGVIEEQLPFEALDFAGALFVFAAGGGAAAVIDEGDGVPAQAEVDTLRGGEFAEGGKNRVRAHAAEPVAGIPGVGLLAMNQAVPVAALGIIDVLRDFVGVGPAIEVEEETGADQGREGGNPDDAAGFGRGAGGGGERHESLSGTIEGEDLCHFGAVLTRVEHATLLL